MVVDCLHGPVGSLHLQELKNRNNRFDNRVAMKGVLVVVGEIASAKAAKYPNPQTVC